MRRAWYAFVAAAAVGAGCSGGGGSSAPPGPAPSTAPQTATVTFSISAGSSAKSKGRERPRYLSSATKSVAIQPIVLGSVGEPVTVIDIAAGAPGCSGSGAALTCSGTLAAPVGQTSFDVTTYDREDATGDVLSAGTITFDVAPSSDRFAITNRQSLTLDAVPARFVLAAVPAAVFVGSAGSVRASATVYDAGGAIVIGPGAFTQPIDVETIAPLGTDPVLHGPIVATAPGCTYPTTAAQSCFVVSAFEGPSAPLTLGYDGEFVSGSSILLVGESPGLPSAVLPIALKRSSACTGAPVSVCPALISFADPASSPVPLTVVEKGATSFEADARNCKDTGAGQIADVNFKDIAFGTKFTVYPLNTAGSCTITISDGALPPNQTVINVTLQSASTPAPSPSPTVSPTPSPLPSGPIAISPSNVVEFANSTAPPQTISASENGFTTFDVEAKACKGIASVSPGNGTRFTVAPLAALTQGGTCAFYVLDLAGGSSPVTVYVDGTVFHIH